MRQLRTRLRAVKLFYLVLSVAMVLVLLNKERILRWAHTPYHATLSHKLTQQQRLNQIQGTFGPSRSLKSNAAVIEDNASSTSDTLRQREEEEADLYELTSMLDERLDIPNDATPTVITEKCEQYKNTRPCLDPNCTAAPTPTHRDRVRSIIHESRQLRLGGSELDAILRLGSNIPRNEVIIASAASKDHFNELQAMFEALHETVYTTLTNFSVVIFDLGLTEEQRRLLKRKCRCQVVTFDFEVFPTHVRDLHCYAWKPIIIRAVAERAKRLIVWQDASIRWRRGFKSLFQRAKLYGQQVVVTDHGGDNARVTAHTVEEMFEYMNETACRFHQFPEIVNAVSLHRPDRLVIKAVLEPWARCALEAGCMCPDNPIKIRRCKTAGGNHACHRFDQSALTLLMAKLFYDEHYKVEVPEQYYHLEIKRGHTAEGYFQSLDP